jgi:uncharacterized OB-fold protein
VTRLPPLPAPPAVSGPFQEFWNAVERGELAIPRCPECARRVWYPADRCPRCGRLGLEWAPVAGRGELFTFTVAYRSFLSPEPLRKPYAVGLVQLEEAPEVRLAGLLAGAEPGELRIGMRLAVTFVEAGGRRLPVWVPA